MLIPRQTNRMVTFSCDQGLPGLSDIQFSHKEVDKKSLNKTLKELFDGNCEWREASTLESTTVLG